jgi:hypothetical protein
MRESLETFLSRERLDAMPFLDANAVIAQKDRHLARKADLGFELWGLMALSVWWRQQTRRPFAAPAGRSDMKRIAFPPCQLSTTPSRVSIPV